MSDRAVYRQYMSLTCEMRDCDNPSSVVCIATGDVGEPSLVVYCGECADEREELDYITPIGEVDHV